MKGIHFQQLGEKGELILRGELGALGSNGKEGVPSTVLFRTGGDQSVRGYAYESLGVKDGSAIVGGRYLAVASVEYQYYFIKNWGVAFFVDAGNAGDTIKELDPAFGYGIGGRWRSPAGPIGVDLAYGERSRNSGFTFLWDLHSDATPPFTPHFHPIPSGGRTGMVRQPGVGIAMDRPESSTGKWRRY